MWKIDTQTIPEKKAHKAQSRSCFFFFLHIDFVFNSEHQSQGFVWAGQSFATEPHAKNTGLKKKTYIVKWFW